MSRPRFTIAGVIAVVALTAVGLAAMRAADDAWDGGLFGLTALTLLTAVLLAVHRRGGRRAYWLGFALFGWAYLVASLVPPVEARLPTSKGLAAAWRLMPGSAILWDDDLMLEGVRSFDIGSTATSRTTSTSPPSPWEVKVFAYPGTPNSGYIKRVVGRSGGTAENYLLIGHSLLAVVYGLMGGWLSRRLYAGNGPMNDGLGGSPQAT